MSSFSKCARPNVLGSVIQGPSIVLFIRLDTLQTLMTWHPSPQRIQKKLADTVECGHPPICITKTSRRKWVAQLSLTKAGSHLQCLFIRERKARSLRRVE